jgi:hypothetical protein
MRPLPLVSAVATLASLALAGCGSSGPGSLTAAELASQGSAICERATAEQNLLHVQNVRLAIPRLEEIGARELAELSKLSPPPSEQGTYHKLLRTGSEVNALLKPLSSALVTEGRAPARLLAHGRELTARLAVLAGSLDMSVCSASSSPAG